MILYAICRVNKDNESVGAKLNNGYSDYKGMIKAFNGLFDDELWSEESIILLNCNIHFKDADYGININKDSLDSMTMREYVFKEIEKLKGIENE